MDVEVCDMCFGMRGHTRLKNAMCDLFESEYTRAKDEHDRLSALLKDVYWYYFETKCKSWKHPWPTSFGMSSIQLNGIRLQIDKRNGRDREIGEFPIYYIGPIKDAPELPPAILMQEVADAADYMEVCRRQVTAPHDWAPGGLLYNELRLQTRVPTESKLAAERISKRIQTANDDNRRDAD